MDLRDYIRILQRYWTLVVGAALAGLLVGGAATVMTKPTYTARTELFVSIQNSGSVQELQQGNTFTQARVQSYVKTAATPIVLQPVIETLGLSISASDLAGKVKAASEPSTVLITITADDASPVQAAAIAQATASSLIKAVETLESPRSGGSSPVNLSIVTPASAPTNPSAPNTKLNLMLGFLLGLAAGIGIAALRALLDTRIRGEADLRNVTDIPLLGAVAFDQGATRKPLLTQAEAQSARAESFRQLRTNLQFTNVSGQAKTVLVTSSLPGEGKSTTATNLAIALSQAGQSVCLIDADLRRPMVGEYLGLDRHAGLTTALVGIADLDEVLQPWGEESLFVLTSGQIPPNPSELLGSEQMQQVLTRLEQTFDTVIIDAPPLLPVTDAAVLSQLVGGVVIVVGCQAIKTQDLKKSLDGLALVNANVLGIVLNRLATKGPDAYSYSYYGYQTKPDEPVRRGRKSRQAASISAASSRRDSPEFVESRGEYSRAANVFPVASQDHS